MNHLSKRIIQGLLKKHGISPKKGFGQNFLIDKRVLRKIIATADLEPKDIILEIGPGTGILTQELAKKVKRVIAVEKDYKMVEILQETTKNLKNVKIIQGDVLKFRDSLNCGTITRRGTTGSLNCPAITRSEATGLKFEIRNSYKVVANLPYYIVSPVIRKLLESKNQPSLMILMVQKEVAQRIVAKPPHMNLLAVSVQFYAKPEIISYVSKKSFWPQPKVDSAILRITPERSRQRPGLCNLFFKIVKAGFSQPRKQIINNLSKGLRMNRQKIENWLLKNKIQPNQRAETLSIQDWLRLTRTFNFT